MCPPSKPADKVNDQPVGGLEGLIKAIPQPTEHAPARGGDGLDQTVPDHQNAAPVDKWDPPFCGDLDMIIRADGRWDYNKTPIGREKLVRLFATVLKREGDDYFLVTPVEKIGIRVEDAPFIAVSMQRKGSGPGQQLQFTTNVGDIITAGPGHELRFQKEDADRLIPYIHVRGGLEARLSRPVYYELAGLAEESMADGEPAFGIWSRDAFYPLETTENMQNI